MVTAARVTPEGLFVRFADEREGVIPFEALSSEDRPSHVVLPDPYVIEVHLADGTVEEVPWDFARHFVERAIECGRRRRSVIDATWGSGSGRYGPNAA